MEKRLPLALLLCLLWVFVYTQLSGPSPGATPLASGPAAGAEGASGPGGPGRTGAQIGGREAPIPPPAAPETAPAEPGRPVPFSGRGFTAEFTTSGAGLAWLQLDDYAAHADQDEALRLVGDVDPGRASLLLRDVEGLYGLDRVAWDLQQGADGRLTFTHETADGLLITRSVEPGAADYTFRLAIDVANQGTGEGGVLRLVLEGAHGLVDESGGMVFMPKPTALAVVVDGAEPELTEWIGGHVDDSATRHLGTGERLLAAGSMTNYFASLLVPEEGTWVKQVRPVAVLDHLLLEAAVQAEMPADEASAEAWRRQLAADHRTNVSADLLLSTRRPDPGDSVRFEFLVFHGPKDTHLAEQTELDFLGPVIESSYGSMAWINRSLLVILRFFQGLTTNWGVAIILLTVVVRALLFPLNRMQQTSMGRYSAVMQQLKPQIDALKERHKNNKRKFNEEQMKLLREHGATPPLGGCLLMFLQFPIWISLFQILRSSIDLRQASFVGWIGDLSTPDRMPFGLLGVETVNLLPILMAAATVLQMRFQPKPADDQQASTQRFMMMFMPVMMLFFLYGYPSGLSLYICTSSLLGVFEFQVIRRVWPVPGSPGGPPLKTAAVATTNKPRRVRG